MSWRDKNRSNAPSPQGSNQSNRPFRASGEVPKPEHNKRRSGRPSDDAREPSINLNFKSNRSNVTEEQLKTLRNGEKKFNIVVDSVPYMVTASPFIFNGKTLYTVRVNGGAQHIFTWDSSLGQLRAIDDDSSTLPDNLEMAISEKLQRRMEV
jgi:hypothetical protein